MRMLMTGLLSVALVGAVAPGSAEAAATPPAARFVVGSVSFSDARSGWALGSLPCGRVACTAVLRTDDGGRSWRRTGAPAARLGGQGASAVSSVRFVDHRHGYAFGGGLWTTDDGGGHWTRSLQVAGIDKPVVTAVAGDARVVWALVSGTDPTYGSGTDGHYRLVRGTPGGRAFQVVADLGRADPTVLVQNGGVAYVDSSRGAVDTDQLLRAGGGADDRRRLPPHCLNVAASSTTALLVECGGGAGGGGMGERRMYASTDSGRSFTRLPDPGRGAGYDEEGLASSADGHALIGTASGAGAAVLSTDDQGKTWRTALAVTGPEGAGLGDLAFQDDQHAVVVVDPDAAAAEQGPYAQAALSGAGVIYRSDDSGNTWYELHLT